MAVATYHVDADGQDVVRLNVTLASEVREVVRAVLATRTPIGHPTLEVWQNDGSSLSLSTDGERALLVRIDADGTSYSSAGAAPDGPLLVFDYRGSWSEAGSEKAVALDVAVAALTEFVERGRVARDLVKFEAD